MANVMLGWCRALPKVELHVHLHGSIREITLVELLVGKGHTAGEAAAIVGVGQARRLVDCFRLFDVVHDVVDSIQVCDLLSGFEACRVSADSV